MRTIKLEWEDMESNFGDMQRAKVFRGWLVRSIQDVMVSMHRDQVPGAGYEWRESAVFVPDPNHEWGNEEEEVMQEGDKDPTADPMTHHPS